MNGRITIKELFNQTRPHPLDPAVRLTDDPASLAIIRLREVRAVIWERGLPENIQNALRTADFSGLELGQVEMPLIVTEGKLNPPASIQADISMLANAFRAAVVDDDDFDLQNRGNSLLLWNFRDKPSLAELVKARFSGVKTIIPHISGAQKATLMTSCKLVTSYTLHPDQGMVWYPGTLYSNSRELFAFSDEFRRLGNPEEILQEFDKEYQSQFMNPGDVIVFKANKSGRRPEELLAHRSPLPGKQTPRIALSLSHLVDCRAPF